MARTIGFRLHAPRIYYGWYIVAAGGANFLAVSGLIFWGFSVFIDPIHQETGWSVAAIAVGSSIRAFESGIFSPFIGYSIDRFGARKMAIIGALLGGSGLFAFSQAHALWQYYAASALIALGMSTGGSAPYSQVLVRWFVRKRGQALGTLTALTALSYFAIPIVTAMIAALGWRGSLFALGVIALGVGIPLAFVIRTDPQRYGLEPDGDPAPLKDDPARPKEAVYGLTVGEAVRTPAFYLLMLGMACGSSVHNVVIIYIVPHLKNAGFTAGQAATYVVIFGLAQVVLRTVGGYLGDRFGRRRLYIASFVFLGTGLLTFANLSAAHAAWMLPLWFCTHFVGHAGISTFPQALNADYFGTRRFATLRGMNSILMTPLGVVLPIAAGLVFDNTGSYRLVFATLGVFSLTGVLWVSLARSPLEARTEAAKIG